MKPLLRNHELQVLAALHFGERAVRPGSSTSWLSGWRRFGGVDRELRLVSDEQVQWMTINAAGRSTLDGGTR